MGTNLSQEKIDAIKENYYQKKKNEKNNNDVKLKLSRESKIMPQNNDYFNITFKRLYKNQMNHLRKDKDSINNINSINNNINIINNNTIIEKEKAKNNIDQLDDNKDINKIIFKNYRSYEENNYLTNDIISNINKEEINTTSISLDTTEYTNSKKIKRDPNSAPDDTSVYSDYIDISQSIFFNKNNNTNNIINRQHYEDNSKRIRDSYYNKLIIKKIWRPYIVKRKSNTIFFFDWDDTLMCTSFIIPIINSNLTNETIAKIKEKIKNLDENISILLNKCLEKGLVFIITNAASGWVEYSSTNFLPLTSKVLSKIKIISAKSLYSKNYPGDPKQWKIKAFKYVINKYNINTKLISNIMAFGDSYIDLEAIENLKYDFSHPFVKIIKFKENPHPVELEKQIWMAISQLDFIINKIKNFSLKVSKKKME